MSTYFSSDFKLGILGGGQLGRMLLQECIKWDIHTSVLDPNKEAPCKNYCNHFIEGNLQNFDDVYNFGKKVDVLTIEIENVNLEALKQLEKEGIKVYPKPNTLEKITSKAEQKKFYKDHQIPTADFSIYQNKEELQKAIGDNKQPLPFIWKIAKGGYDGKGVGIIQKLEDLKNVPQGECIAEDMIPFEKELAITVARNPSGEVKTFPVVEMEFHPTANQVEYVLCPANISEEVSLKAQKVAMQVANSYQNIGLLAIEMFLTKENEILVNEVAPRPHNSGHLSIEANFVNQFEQHLRAILNLPLGDSSLKTAAVMVNLVGKEGYEGNVYYKGLEDILKLDGVTPHIYGKKETKAFRKMGHITIASKTIDRAKETAQKAKEMIQVIEAKN